MSRCLTRRRNAPRLSQTPTLTRQTRSEVVCSLMSYFRLSFGRLRKPRSRSGTKSAKKVALRRLEVKDLMMSFRAAAQSVVI